MSTVLNRVILAGERLILDYPFPSTASGLRVLVNGGEAAISSIAPQAVTYQVSWETSDSAAGVAAEVVLQGNERAFEAVIAVQRISATAAEFISVGSEQVASGSPPRQLYAIHGDWRGNVRRSDPAFAAEIIHLYATGLGPVSPAVPTGMPSPAVPPAAASVTCTWISDSPLETNAEVLFAGLAPGIIGVYQLTVRTPEFVGSGVQQIGLRCLDGQVRGVEVRPRG